MQKCFFRDMPDNKGKLKQHCVSSGGGQCNSSCAENFTASHSVMLDGYPKV